MSATDQSNPATRVATPLPKTAEKVPDSPFTVVAELPPEDNALADASRARKITLMVLFSTAQFLDAFNNRFVYTLARPLIVAHPLYLCTARCFLRFPTSLKGSPLPLPRRRGSLALTS